MLAVILDRHSNIAIPPETQFFSEFLSEIPPEKKPKSRKEMVEFALNFKRIRDLKLDRTIVLSRFHQYEEMFPNLLRAILETYAATHGKVRSGEKSPKHIEHVPAILDFYPKAKVICIVRDGRDVVQSLLGVPWAEPGNPRRLGLFCTQWSDHAELAMNYVEIFSKEQFLLVKYENILLNPIEEMMKICEFIGEKYEPTQLDAQANSEAIPEWEKNWKSKAINPIDPERVAAWRRTTDQDKIWFMNSMMGATLARMGYRDTSLKGCPAAVKLKLKITKIPYLKPMRSLSLFGLKVLRKLNSKQGRGNVL
jgi:hypothetical protein